jgi:hypothetical protein
MKPADAILILVALALGVLVAISTNAWIAALDSGQAEVRMAKAELLASAGLMELHNAVYAKVGERTWEERVKPEFMSRIIWQTVAETGDPFPRWQDVVGWVRANPEKARSILEGAARKAERMLQGDDE